MSGTKPIAHLVWLQGMRAPDDVEDYFEVARPGDKCVDGSDAFPVFGADAFAAKDAHISELRSKLFPYADATEISGISWDGKYLIGDKKSISYFHEMKNRGEQIDVYKRAYDQNIAAKDAEISKIREALTNILNEETVSVHMGYDNGPGGGNFLYADAVLTESDAFIAARAALAKAGEA